MRWMKLTMLGLCFSRGSPEKVIEVITGHGNATMEMEMENRYKWLLLVRAKKARDPEL